MDAVNNRAATPGSSAICIEALRGNVPFRELQFNFFMVGERGPELQYIFVRLRKEAQNVLLQQQFPIIPLPMQVFFA